MTEPESQRIVAVLFTAFATSVSRLSDQQLADMQRLYRRMMLDLPYPEANAAVERIMATSRFLPTIAEIRDSAVTVQQGERRAGGSAWGEVIAAIGRYGYMRQPGVDFTFSDEVTHRCVLAMNWRELCNSENQTADRARFIELYDQLAATERRDAVSRNLPAAKHLRAIQASDESKQLVGVVANALTVKK